MMLWIGDDFTNRNTISLIQGNIIKGILCFSAPLLIGNLFQQLYNTIDSYVVGNYVSKQALAAVGASTPIVNMLIGFFMGLATGAGVVIAQYYGSNLQDGLKKSIQSSLALTLMMSFVLTVVGVSFTNPLLHFIGVPEDVFPESSLYLKIYFAGISFNLIYNMGAGILRAVGDSKRPLYFLIVASLINIVLDFLFVKYIRLGVAGAGYATLFAQAVSSLLVIYKLTHTTELYCLNIKDISFDPMITKQIIKLGLPTGIQQGIVSLSNVIVQSYVNVFGSSVMAGYSASIRIDGFVNLPLQSFNMAITTFVAQNIGAKNFDRVKKGTRITMFMTLTVIAIISILLYFYGENAIAVFNNEHDVVKAGRLIQLTFIPFYIFLPITQIYSGTLKGIGKTVEPTIIMIFNFVILRQIYLAIITKIIFSITFVFLGWALTWITSAIMFIFYYHKVDLINMKRL